MACKNSDKNLKSSKAEEKQIKTHYTYNRCIYDNFALQTYLLFIFILSVVPHK